MRLTALVESPEHVCCRYRLTAFQPALAAARHSLTLQPLPRHPWGWLRLAPELRQADAVVLQRKLLPAWQLFLLRRASRLLLYDIDDAVFLRDSYAPRGMHSRRRRRRFRAIARAADAVLAGNSFLCEQVRALAAAPAAYAPTCVDVARYPLASHRASGKGVQLVWIGSSSTLQGLEQVRPLLEEIGQHCPGVRLKLICDRFLSLLYLPVLACPWTEAGEAADLAAADIGISWLPDDLWSRGKCGLKVIQYMAAGLPVVANPVGVQAHLVRHGETGFLVRTPDEWVAAVGRLARDPDLRRRLGQAGRARVAAEFSVAAGAARWLALLERLPRQRGAA